MLTTDSNHKFTFSIEGKEYVINEKPGNGKKEKKKSPIHGPSIIIGAAITAICVIIVSLSINVNNFGDELTETEMLENPTEIRLETFYNNASPILGDPNAPITLIEFGDFQCHFCNVYFHNTEPVLLENFVKTGKVNVIFKDYIIIGPDSFTAAHATHCADDQDGYWKYHNILYNNWTGENNGWASNQNLMKYANEIELDLGLFIECMNSNRYNDLIEKSNNDARKLGLSGTPAFFIHDKKTNTVQVISGAQPYESFERVFNSILEK